MLKDGLSLIPVRDKQEGDRLPKTPCQRSWTPYQTQIIDKGFLYQEMEKYDTTAVAIVCGPVSGNLEVIDIDSKYKDGISALLFAKIKDVLPELYDRIRVHKTPSGGYHILYRIENPPAEFPGNMKLAGRMATPEELQERPKNKQYNFLETRGDKGYVLAPPSLDYEVRFDRPMPVITWAERCDLINICQSFNEIIVYKPTVKPKKADEEYYDLTPWEDFNMRGDVVSVLDEAGWKPIRQKADKYLYFCRPGKDKGVSASLNLETRILWSYTVSTELEEKKGYKPVDLLLLLRFNGDSKKCYHYLTGQGFGRVKDRIQKSIVKKAAISGKDIPRNFTPEAKELFESLKIEVAESYPYGTFIKYDAEEERRMVSRQVLYEVAAGLGFRYYNGDLVRIVGKTIDHASEREFQDVLKRYMVEDDPDEYEEMCNVYEKFMKENCKYSISRLQLLDDTEILKDTKDESFKFYNNGFLMITAASITFHDYDEIDKLIWAHKIQDRAYKAHSGGKFTEYLRLALNDFESISPILGYLSHEYKDETTGYIIVLSETCENPKDGGGSGKNVLCNLLKLTTSYTSKPGVQAKFDEKFFQSWNRQRIFGISDVPKNFDFAFLKEPSTGSFIWKRLFKDEIEVPVEDAPKFIVQTNFSYDCSDGGLKRRIIPVEFSDFFTKAGGLDVHFGVHFPNGWTDDDYNDYDTFIAQSIQRWMQAGLKLSPTPLTYNGWVKQFKQTFGEVAASFVIENWEAWTEAQFISNEDFKSAMMHYFEENNVTKNYQPSMNKINDAIASYAQKHGCFFDKDHRTQVSFERKRGKFISTTPF